MSEQEAIERLRAWMPHVDRGASWTTSRQADLRDVLDSHDALVTEYHQQGEAYIKFRQGIRSAIAPVHMSNPLVSDQWIIDRVGELLDSHERMRLALEGVWKIEERVGYWHPNGGPEPPDGDHAEICSIVREGLGAYWGPNEEAWEAWNA